MMNHIEPAIFLILITSGYYVLERMGGIGQDPAAAASLSGALFGSATILLGNWINRANDRRKAAQEQADEVKKLKALIVAELIDVAIGLLEAKRFIDAAVGALRANGPVDDSVNNMNSYRPRQMPFTQSLGTKLLALENEAIYAIASLRSDLAATRQIMDEVTAGGAPFDKNKAILLSKSLGNNMTVLAMVFERIEPTHMLSFPNAKPELTIKILERSAKTPDNPYFDLRN